MDHAARRGPAARALSGAGRVALADLDYRGAAARIARLAWRTPLYIRPGAPAGPPVFLKAEGLQATGSFKVRGAANFLLRMDPAARDRGVVACSSGNHGRAVAHVAQTLGVPATICVPDWVDPAKRDSIEGSGATVQLSGPSYDEAEDRAAMLAERDGLTLVHPFDHPWIVEGQGTIGVEIADAVEGPPTIAVPLSGGGLAAGIGGGVGQRWPNARIVGVSADRANTMGRSIAAGHPVDAPEAETVAEALSGGIGRPNRFTFRWVQEAVDHHLEVPEAAIARAVAFAYSRMGLVLEGGGAVALAAWLDGALRTDEGNAARPLVIVLSGSNIAADRLAPIIHRFG